MSEPTPTVFRVFRDGGDVLALMPTIPGDVSGACCSSYQHVGQHGQASYNDCIRITRPATPTEYAPLLKELERVGYTVKPIKRASYQMYQQRRAEARA